MNPKILVMYLPQFHQIPENDVWWGKGFTDWKTVKLAKPLFKGHIQPVVPLRNNYYDLSSEYTIQWQASLMKKFGIYGACIYHYWFKGGRKILEKPVEIILEKKHIDIHYCFCWANESWVRSWSNFVDGNVWTRKFEKKEYGNNSGVLLEQSYGNEDDWKEHFNYFRTFFKDKRYIKYKNRPILVIYKPAMIYCLREMLQLWNYMALEDGFDGIYIILANCDKGLSKNADLQLVHEPQATFHRLGKKKVGNISLERVYNYDEIIESSLKHYIDEDNISYGGFVRYDDTPRRGSDGSVILGASPKKFQLYIEKLLAKNEVCNSPFVFINAWNEWGEGMFLEPDEMYGEAYLTALIKAKKNYQKQIFNVKKDKSNHACEKEYLNVNYYKKMELQAKILHYWLTKKEMKRSFGDYLLGLGYCRVAVYGLGILGRHLLMELSDSEVEIVYVTDRNKKLKPNIDVPVLEIDNIIEEIDCMIVTVVQEYGKISLEIKKRFSVKTISLEQIVMEC